MIKLIIYLFLLHPTPQAVFEECILVGIQYPEIVTKQFILETGWGKSYNCTKRNNLFGLTKPRGGYFVFNHWRESVQGYKTKVQYKYKGGNYYDFLLKIGYATDPNYIKKLKTIRFFPL